uniref:Uncharacterized protein n=1 Tax=Leersia perrieri TaxID=77586 RepID=A0A0D9XGL4_9ORYZ
MTPIDADVYGGAGNMCLSLTGATMAAPELSVGIFPDHHQARAQPMASSGDVLCLGGDHLMASSYAGSSMF